jgi:hypothetical protein
VKNLFTTFVANLALKLVVAMNAGVRFISGLNLYSFQRFQKKQFEACKLSERNERRFFFICTAPDVNKATLQTI